MLTVPPRLLLITRQVDRVVSLLKEKNMGIVAHFYMDPEVSSDCVCIRGPGFGHHRHNAFLMTSFSVFSLLLIMPPGKRYQVCKKMIC